MESKSHSKRNIAFSIAGVIFAIFIFIVSAYASMILVSTLAALGGGSENVFSKFFREALSLWCGGFAAMAAVDQWIERANKRIVFYGFVSFVALLSISYFIYVVPFAEQINVSKLEIVFTEIGLLIAVISAYVYSKKQRNL